MFIFDFDGVLIDSVDEIAVTTYNLLTESSASSLGELPSGYLELFRLNRCRPSRACDLVLTGKWCLERMDTEPNAILSASDARTLFSLPREQVEQIEGSFFKTRNDFSATCREKWLALNTPYQPLWSRLQHLGGKRVVVITNKNRQAVIDIFRHYRLEVPEENIYARDGLRSKVENLRLIAERFKPSKVYLVEDCLENLLELKQSVPPKLCFFPIFALWGYVAPEDRSAAENAGIAQFSQQELIELLNREFAS